MGLAQACPNNNRGDKTPFMQLVRVILNQQHKNTQDISVYHTLHSLLIAHYTTCTHNTTTLNMPKSDESE